MNYLISDIPNSMVIDTFLKTEFSNSYFDIQEGKHKLENGKFKNPFPTWFYINKSKFFLLCLRDHFFKDINKLTLKENLNNVMLSLPTIKSNCMKYENNLDDIQITWVGHSTYLIRHNNVTFITDPVFSDRASPVQWKGPKRIKEVPFKIQDIDPKINVVLLSHDHFDHLDLNSIQELEIHHKPLYFVPLGKKSWFTSKPYTFDPFGIYLKVDSNRVIEMNWFESSTLKINKNITLHFVPAQHWSVRLGNDEMKSLWGGWIIESKVSNRIRKIFFAGDTGYCEIFKDIGIKYGEIDLSLIPIGAYGNEKTRWFLKNQHCDVSEAVQIAIDTRSKNAIGCHWGTFVLTPEPTLEPKNKLKEIVKNIGKSEDWFIAMQHGETKIY